MTIAAATPMIAGIITWRLLCRTETWRVPVIKGAP